MMRINKYLLFFSVVFLFVIPFFCPNTASAYRYEDAKAPMVNIFESAVVAAQNKNWPEVSNWASKGIALQRNHIFPADYLAPRFKSSIDEKNITKTALYFANLVYLSIIESLTQNRKETLRNIKIARKRTLIAYKSYRQILHRNVKKHNSRLSRLIIEQFKILIGNSGILNVYTKTPDIAKYIETVETIENSIETVFPSFADRK